MDGHISDSGAEKQLRKAKKPVKERTYGVSHNIQENKNVKGNFKILEDFSVLSYKNVLKEKFL